LFAAGVPLTHVLVQAGLAASNSEGVRLIRSGGISLNGERVTDERQVLTLGSAGVSDGIFRIDRGKKQRIVVEIAG